jgi:two-component system sensor histidine kinase BaeS
MQDGIREVKVENLASLHSEVISLSKLVNDLREISLAETGGLSFKKELINPLEIIDKSLSNFETRFAARGIKIENKLDSNGLINIYGDPDKFKQVISNLFENALRYVNSPGLLKVWYSATDKYLTLNFEDNGIGVPEESLPRLFDRFYRVERSRNRVKGGSGLGLAICRHIVAAHKGKIKAANVQTRGLRIEIELPLTSDQVITSS